MKPFKANYFSYLLLIMSFFYALPTICKADEYIIDNEHSFITFSVRHFNAGYVLGRFNNFSGSIYLDKANFENSTVNVTIESLSIDTGVAKRDFHLRTNEFLDILKFPNITFNSIKINTPRDNKYFIITGNLKIKDKVKTILIKSKKLGESTDPKGVERIAFEGVAVINRFDYGINYNEKLQDHNPTIGEKIYITAFIEAVKKGKE
jgi:polyisoprenoid-binding protein YceI